VSRCCGGSNNNSNGGGGDGGARGGGIGGGGGGGGATPSPSPAAPRRRGLVGPNLQLLLGLMALVASTTFAVRRQFGSTRPPTARLRLARSIADLTLALSETAAADGGVVDERDALLEQLLRDRLRRRQDRGVGTTAGAGGDGGHLGGPTAQLPPVVVVGGGVGGGVGGAGVGGSGGAAGAFSGWFGGGSGGDGRGGASSDGGGSKDGSADGGASYRASANSLAADVQESLAAPSPIPPPGSPLGGGGNGTDGSGGGIQGGGNGTGSGGGLGGRISPPAASDGGPTLADAAALLARLGNGSAAAAAPLPQSGPNGTLASPSPQPAWYTCPRWNGTEEERVASCSGGSRDPNGYVHLVSTREGMSAWTHVIWEMLRYAKSMNRSFVEPCVAGGEIIPCTPGRVVTVPESVRKSARFGPITGHRDPLRVKAFLGACGVAGRDHGIQKRLARAYPLRLYLDMRALRQYWRKIVTFDEWVAAELCHCNDDGLEWDGHHVTAELGYCVAWGPRAAQIRSTWCSPDQGPFRFGAVWAPRVMPEAMPHWVRDGRFQGHMFYYLDELRADPRRNQFFWNVWRGAFEPLGTHKKAPRFNEIHEAAVDAWLTDRLGLAAVQYAVFQWRSEQVEDAQIYPCAVEMARVSRPVIDAIRGPELNGGVLVADIPAPNNPCMMWKEYHASNRNTSEHRRAVRKLLGAGMVKYDRDHPGLDSGVLSIRDWLLATKATYYVTCAGTHDKCRACFRAESKFIHRIVEARKQASRSSFTRWFDLTPKALFALSAGPPKPYNITAPETAEGLKDATFKYNKPVMR
jgi:hypothetical protein